MQPFFTQSSSQSRHTTCNEAFPEATAATRRASVSLSAPPTMTWVSSGCGAANLLAATRRIACSACSCS